MTVVNYRFDSAPAASWSHSDTGAGELLTDGGLVDIEACSNVLERQASLVETSVLNELVGQLADVWPSNDAGSLEVFECCLAVDAELFGELHDSASALVAKYELLYNLIR